MNRRSFFTKLAIGAIAAPAIAKVLAEPPKTKISYAGPRLWVSGGTAMMYHGEIEWYYIKDNGVSYRLDQNPLRFTNDTIQ